MLFSIGDFSKICEVPVYTLRYWEKEGLLIPEKIDAITGYRFYSSRQLYLVQGIKEAKLNKFKNKEIRSIVDNSFGMQLLLNQRYELIKTKIEAEDSIRRLDFAINNLRLHKWPNYKCVLIKSIPEGAYITHRKVYENIYQLCDDFVYMYNCIWHGKPPYTNPYECFVIYYHDSFPEKNLDAECCAAVDANFNPKCCKNDYQVKKIPAVEMAASCLHYGPHEMVGETFAYLLEWVDANELAVCGYPRLNVLSNESTPNITNYEFLSSNESLVCEISEIILPVQKKE